MGQTSVPIAYGLHAVHDCLVNVLHLLWASVQASETEVDEPHDPGGWMAWLMLTLPSPA